EEELAEVEEAKAWRRKAFDAGFGWIQGPSQYGGRELPANYERLWNSLQSDFDTPSLAPFGIGLGMVAPTILAHATDTAKDRYLRSMYRGEIVGCQLFSEPVAGSDLAGLQTKAVRDGDEWIINGQKVWTSGAHIADLGMLVARSNIDVPKHKGLTYFLLDMHQPGIEVRPLRELTGRALFNEVFMTDVRVSNDAVLGGLDNGWAVTNTTLAFERAGLGAGSSASAESAALPGTIPGHLDRRAGEFLA